MAPKAKKATRGKKLSTSKKVEPTRTLTVALKFK